MTIIALITYMYAHGCGHYWPERATLLIHSPDTGNSMFVEVGCRD